MPLRDHFHPPIAARHSWDMFHGQWPAMIVLGLSGRLPAGYLAGPNVHRGQVEFDVGTFEQDDRGAPGPDGSGEGGVALYAPPRPTVAVTAGLPDPDAYEVLVYDAERGRRLVAAVEIVSPSNKDRPESRRTFVDKCVAYLREGVAVTVVDLVTDHHFNLYADLLASAGRTDPSLGPEPPPVYAASCRWTKRRKRGLLETWSRPLALGQPLPTLPVWLSERLAVPLELEESYEGTCRALRIP